jgi:hypothetical protein
MFAPHLAYVFNSPQVGLFSHHHVLRKKRSMLQHKLVPSQIPILQVALPFFSQAAQAVRTLSGQW